MTHSLESIEARMDRQWEMMLTQFRTQADQMTTISQQLAASTPRPLTPSNLQSPPGTVVVPETISEGSEPDMDNSSWLQGRPLVVEPHAPPTSGHNPLIVGARTIRYASVVTPGSHTFPHTGRPSPPPSTRSLFGGSQSGSGAGALYGTQRTRTYLSGYYWEPGLPESPQSSIPWLELSLQGPYDGKSDKLQKAPLSLADDTLT